MATVYTGSVRNVQDCLRSSVPIIKWISQKLYWWPKTRSISWSHYKPMENVKILPTSYKMTQTTQFFQDHGYPPPIYDDLGAIDDRGSQGGHLTPIGHNRMEIGANGAKRLGSSSCLAGCAYWPSWAMIWPWPGLRSNFEIDLWMSKGVCFKLVQWGEHDGVIFIFVSLMSKKVINEKPFPWKTIIFHLMTSETQLLTLGQIWLKKVAKAWRELPNALFKFFLATYHTWGDNSDWLEKNCYFLKIWHLVTPGDLIIDPTWKWHVKKFEISSQSILCCLLLFAK